MATAHEAQLISPIGTTSHEAAARRCRRSDLYRQRHDQLAPYRAIARTVIHGRGARRWTQQQLADELGTTNTAVSRIESGRHAVSLDTLQRLSDVLGVSFTIGPATAPIPEMLAR
jgi:ribosome-binding protein aMBF1 (putative translation factor)